MCILGKTRTTDRRGHWKGLQKFESNESISEACGGLSSFHDESAVDVEDKALPLFDCKIGRPLTMSVHESKGAVINTMKTASRAFCDGLGHP